jgi:hypothetical protein
MGKGKATIHYPIGSFSVDEFFWSRNATSGYKAVLKEELDRGPPGGRMTTCECMKGEVERSWGVTETARWEIKIPLFRLYRHLQGVKNYLDNDRPIPTESAWWLPQA